MANKKYNSYQEIERDLKILKLEKQISLEKLKQSGTGIKDSFGFTSVLPDIAIGAVNTFAGGAKGAILGFILRKLFRR